MIFQLRDFINIHTHKVNKKKNKPHDKIMGLDLTTDKLDQ